MFPKSFIFTVFLTFFIFIPFTSGLDCYSCQNCEENFNSSLIVQCPSKQARCITIQYPNGIVDRACGKYDNHCKGRDNFRFPTPTQRPQRPTTTETPRLRKRALLGNPKEKETEFDEVASIKCCKEDQCNKSTKLSQPASTSLMLVLAFTLILMLQPSRFHYSLL